MFISEIFASGFRCFGAENALTLELRRGLNILVGPNDAGKTAIIDAPRYVLWTRGDDFVRLDANDFHADAAGRRVPDLLIRCTFDSLKKNLVSSNGAPTRAAPSGCTYVFALFLESFLGAANQFRRNIVPAKTPRAYRSKEIFAST